jgi:hypothetical protein
VAALAIFVAGGVALFWLVLRYGGGYSPMPPEPDVMRWLYRGPVERLWDNADDAAYDKEAHDDDAG